MAVFALVTAGIYQVFIPVLKFARSTNERLYVQQDVRLAMDRMARDIRESVTASLHVYPWPPDTSGPAIAVVTARPNCSGTFTLNPGTGGADPQAVVYLVWDQASGELRRYCDTSTTRANPAAPVTAGPYTVLARNVQNLTFTRVTHPVSQDISIRIDLQAQTPRGDAERYIRTEFVPHNEF